jgi:hypothetical protein
MDIINRIFGFTYLVNLRSGEIHNLKNKHKNCHINLIPTLHRWYVRKSKAIKLIQSGCYNGCRWCMGDLDSDKW